MNQQTDVSIRPLSLSDWRQWKTIRLEALKNSPENFASSFEEEILKKDEEWQKFIAENSIFGAFINNSIVGSIGFHRPKQTKCSHSGMLWGVYVTPAKRGLGIAEMLLQSILDAVQHTVIQIILKVTVPNQSAIRLYQKKGFTIYGIEPGALKLGDRYYDLYLMVLQVSSVNCDS